MGKEHFSKIFSEQYPHDMSAWLCQKSEAIIKDIIHLMETLKGNIPNKNLFDNYPYNDPYFGTVPKEVYNSIYGILFDITKIYSFSLGAKWDSSDREIILSDLKNGLEKLQKKYGLINNTKKEEIEQKVKEFVTNLKALIHGDRYPNRQEINNLFDIYKDVIYYNDYYSHIFNNMERILDSVNLGYLEWNDYVVEMRNMLEGVEEKLEAYKSIERMEKFTVENIIIKDKK